MAGTKISELPVATLPLAGTELVPVVQSGATKQTTLAAMPYVPAGTGAVTTTVQAKLRESVSVKDFGAKGDGVTDDTAAIQAAIDSGKPVFVPTGTYYLATSLKVENGNVIYGVNGRGAGYSFETTGSYFKPATCAIQTKDYTHQYSNFTLHNIGFLGGTIQVDLGLFHEVDITDCWFVNPSVGCLVIVRGEKQRIERVRCDSNGTGAAIFGFSLGRWEESLYNGYSNAYFAPGGAFFDRASIKDVAMQSGVGSSCFAYGIKSNILSGAVISNFIVHGIQDAREQNVIYIRDRIQQSQIIGCSPDTFGNASSPAPAIFEFQQVKQCTFLNVSPAFSGNNNYVKGITATSGFFGATFTSCRVGGNNSTYYGFYIPVWVGQDAVLIDCDGAYFSASANTLIKSQITQISCRFDYNNGFNSSSVIQNNQNKYDLMMADFNGAVSCTSSWGVLFAKGSGNFAVPFSVQNDRISLNGQSVLYASAAPTTGTWSRGDIVYNTAPASAGYVGWVCTAAGTPGTWKAFGLIT
jgi:uncharacterized protein YfiM (DUF2279 family)